MQKNLITHIIAFVILVVFSTMGCEPHRIEIQQGNKIDSTALSKLKIGMSRKQVTFLLGSPLLTDAFHKNRWDYIYYLKSHKKPVIQSRITLYFDNKSLIKIDDSAYVAGINEKTPE